MVEARELISNGLIWIYESEGEATSICAVTRSTQNVSAITKVYTTPKWRRRGFAEHLVRNVTSRFVTIPFNLFGTQTHYAVISLLVDCGKQSVTLYVGHSNSAQRVYDRVGFVGLCGKEKVNGVEDSLELGLVTGAPRGHW
jgi:predicted GNAT family acetyltransferase